MIVPAKSHWVANRVDIFTRTRLPCIESLPSIDRAYHPLARAIAKVTQTPVGLGIASQPCSMLCCATKWSNKACLH